MGGGNGGMKSSQRGGGALHHGEFRDRGPYTSTLSVDEPWDEELANSLREVFASPWLDNEGDPLLAGDPFQRFLNGTAYGRDDHAQKVPSRRLDELVASQRSPYLYMWVSGSPREPHEDSYAKWLTEGRPISRYGGVATLYEPHMLSEQNGDRYLRATFKPNVRMNVIKGADARDLLRRFEARHGALTEQPAGVRRLRESVGAMSALAAAKGFDVIRYGTPDTGYSYKVLNRGVLVTDGVGGPYRGEGY